MHSNTQSAKPTPIIAYYKVPMPPMASSLMELAQHSGRPVAPQKCLLRDD
jgi:hypothetical protein